MSDTNRTIFNTEEGKSLDLGKSSYKNKKDFESPLSKQSANTLFHFLGELEYLEDILTCSCIYPRYCKEEYNFLPRKFPNLIFPMRCFCDIYIEKLSIRCDDYGRYGIGFKRDIMLKRGVQPVQYINDKSDLKKNLYEAARKYRDEYNSILKPSNNFQKTELFKRLKYSKTLVAKITSRIKYRGRGKTHKKFLPDEKEWRYVPSFGNDVSIPFFLDENEDNINPNYKQEKNKDLRSSNKYKLDFKYDDIKYLVVPDEVDRDQLIKYIWYNIIEDPITIQTFSKDKADEIIFEKLTLISKIIVLNHMKDDM